MSNSLSSQTQTRVLFKRGMLPVICSKLPAHIQLNIPGLCSRWMRLGEGCVTSKMSTILCFHYGHSPWNQSCFQRRNLVLRSRWTPRTMARTSFCLTNMPHPLPAWNGSDPLLEVYGMRDHSLGQNTEGPWWWDGRPYPIYIYIHIYISIYRYIDIPIVLTVEHMGTGQLSRPGGHRMMLLTRGESTCPTMLAASKYKDIWPVRLLANTSPSGNIPGIPWISQTIWEYPKISPNIRSSAEACQDSVGQRGASTVENDPWSTSLQWIPEPGTAWPRGTAFNGDGGTWTEPRWF